jgi:hypothetical protein
MAASLFYIRYACKSGGDPSKAVAFGMQCPGTKCKWLKLAHLLTEKPTGFFYSPDSSPCDNAARNLAQPGRDRGSRGAFIGPLGAIAFDV